MGIIDNKNSNTLVTALSNALSTGQSLDISTAFFFFSGFSELVEHIKDINVRVIVGMDLDPKMIQAKRITDDADLSRYRPEEEPATTTAKIKTWRDAFIALFNNTDVFDTERMSGALDIFFEKLHNGTLEVRMHLKTDHAKYYLIHNNDSTSQDGANPGTRIMGSSNFTLAGLKGQGELNDRRIDPDDFRDYQERFEDAWSSSKDIPLLDKHSANEFLAQVRDETSLFEDPNPYLVYIRVLKELFDRPDISRIKSPKSLTESKYADLQYQTDAITDGLDILEKYNGVIVADVVGLGKSIIASAIAANLKNRTIIIAPPHLEQQWEDYAYDFGIACKIYTTGKIELALKENGYKKGQTIIIDEAHRFRNEDTYNYQDLHKLCLNNKVVLLTATPFNNDPKDLFALIRLFDAPSQSRIQTVDNLSMEFRQLISRYGKMRRQLHKMDEQDIRDEARGIAERMRTIASPVIIRRSRVDLEAIKRYKLDLTSQGYSLPNVNDPVLLEYSLGRLSDLYTDTLEQITDKKHGFTAARYQPVNFVNDIRKFEDLMKTYYNDIEEFRQAQTNLAEFMRKFLVLRFESSMAAFDKTLSNFIQGHRTIIKWYEQFNYVPIYKKGKIPDPETLEETFGVEEVSREMSEDFLEKALMSSKLEKDVEKGLMLIPSSLMRSDFIDSLKNDVKLLSSLQQSWRSTTKGLSIDPKVEDVKTRILELRKQDTSRKIIIFTTYTDTADYLEGQLANAGVRVFKYTGTIATATNKNVVKNNFDASLDENEQADDFDVLVATDAISEGYNLHRAGVIVNYDIPYNPVRVVQRIGRINRINKKMFDELVILNCFPTLIGEDEVAIKRISSLKINLMNELMGTDSRALTPEEMIQTFFVDKFQEENAIINQESWDAKYINLWDEVRFDKKLIKDIANIKKRSLLARKSNHKGMILFGKRGKSLPVFVANMDSQEASRVPASDILHLLEATLHTETIKRSPDFKAKFEVAQSKLFQPDQMPENKGRRNEAIDVLEYLKSKHLAARSHCDDAKEIIKELDGFPEGLLKRIVDMQKVYFKNKDFVGAYNELQEIASIDYMTALKDRVSSRSGEQETLLIAEELM